MLTSAARAVRFVECKSRSSVSEENRVSALAVLPGAGAGAPGLRVKRGM